MRRALAAVLTIATLLGGAASARASGGSYAFDGGTPAEQATVRAALDASAFPWSIVPQQVTIHVAPGTDSYATPGQIWLDANLLDAGRFAWGTVQHEYAHQVDFLLLDQSDRAQLQALLGGRDWCGEVAGLAHDDHGCERFADTVAAAYWPSPDNTATAFAPADRFRALLDGLLGIAPTRSLQAVTRSASAGSPSRRPPSACPRRACSSPSARASARSRER